MAGITLADAEEQLAAWLAASKKVAGGQSYSIAGRSLSRADLQEINESIKFWQTQVNRLQPRAGGIRVRGGTPIME